MAGRRVTRGHYEAMADIATGFKLGDTLRIRRNEYTVVGLTRRMVSSGGDPMVFIPLKDAQEAQFLKDNDAIVQIRARTAANPSFNRPGVPGLLSSINASQSSSSTVNAVLVRLRDGADADEVAEVVFSPDELRIDVFRASGAGGQHVNKTESAVRITHLPTGTVAECQDDRSQHKNKERAMKVLAARVRDKQLAEQQAKEASTRKLMIGSGDRSERIRTYNFPQGRITDHRINLTLYKIEQIMDGDLTEMTDALIAEHQAELLAALGEQDA